MFERIAPVAAILIVALAGACGTACAFDGASSKQRGEIPAEEALQTGIRAYMAGDKTTAVTSLLDAAERGSLMAQWKIARMYAEGDGVDHDDVKAFDYFSQIANAHADDDPQSERARFVSTAFVALGKYYLNGIPRSPIRADAERARAMFFYAANYFGDRDAQYSLAQMYINAPDGGRDPWRAAQWLGKAANKGQREAQAVLGRMLFYGLEVPRQRARGLMWLTLANNATGGNAKWISDLYREAIEQASPEEQESAEAYVSAWNKDR